MCYSINIFSNNTHIYYKMLFVKTIERLPWEDKRKYRDDMGKRKPKLSDRNCFVFPQIHVSLLTENDVICIWSIVNLSQLWHLLMAKRIETDQKHIKNCIFSLKYLVNPIKSTTFDLREPAKPLHNA